ncbi:MAG: response regulator transcription factor [Dehalococcoidales bacterium]|nr:response regulator transcription factor [Dehalococcoidales bacterium]
MIQIVLADDHKIVRHGIKALLETEADFSVIGEASDGLEAIRQTENLRPDILVVDISMPGLNGIDVTRKVKKDLPKTNVIILSMHSAEVYVHQALKVGAMGYVIKESGPEQLLNAIREAAAGRYYVSPPLSHKIIDDYLAQLAPENGHEH